MDVVKQCTTIGELQTLVDAEIWRGDERLKNAIQERAVDLALEQGLQRIELHHDEWMDDMDDDCIQDGGQAEVSDWKKHCVITEQFNQHVKRFGINGHAFNVKFKNMSQVSDLNALLIDLFDALFEHVDVAHDEVVGVEVKHPDLDHPILIPFRKNHTSNVIVRDIERVIQSNASLSMDDRLSVQITKVKLPEGSGKKRKIEGNYDEFVKKARCVIDVPGHDNLCLPRALVTAKAMVDNCPQWNTIRRGDTNRNTLQLNRAKELIRKVGLENHIGPWSLAQVQIFQSYLSGYQIKIFTSQNCSDIVFKGPDGPKCLNLYLHNNHFIVITKMTGFLGTSYYCENCNKTYQNIGDHRNCVVKCDMCFAGSKCAVDNIIQCINCMRWFANQTCLDNHKKKLKTKSLCETLKWCVTCKVEYRTRHKHKCDTLYYKFCKDDVPKCGNHQCYMPSYKAKDDGAKSYIFFDFESEQVKVVGQSNLGSHFLHTPVCVVIHKVCDKCWNERDMSVFCPNCKTRKRVFTGESLLDDFVKWLFSSENTNCIAMAHNNRGYDGQMILESLHRNAVNKPEIIFKGLEIMRLKLNGVTLLDSLNFLPMSLSAMPKAFNLTEMKKGYFPHLFTSMDKWNYVGPLPDAYFYQAATMKQKDKVNFFRWYLSNKNHEFNFQKELLEYCNSDVDILKMSVMSFRDTFMEQTGLDPYWNAMTISDACIKVFRMNFLPEKMIGLLPLGEYRSNDRYSIICIKWLRWVAQEENISIRHSLNGGEVQVSVQGQKFKVDGINGNDIYELMGCLFHGCPKCFGATTFLPLTGKLSRDCHLATMERSRLLRSVGYNVIEKWECELKLELRMNTRMNTFFKDQNLIEPIKARDSYFGGRTNVAKLHHKVSGDEEIHYVDICSLYPYVCKYGVFPIGHPKIITENFSLIKDKPYQGLIKCRVLPPKALYHPVLPVRMHGKLMFPLCKTCATLKLRDKCEHSNEERCFWGTWITLELYKAMDLGYEVLEIAEVWDFGDQVKCGGADGLFTEYVNEFLRLKQEASDWPKWCRTSEDRELYLSDYLDHEGIELKPENIRKNGALRALAKLCLNSFYGKFGQRENMIKSVFVTEPCKFFELVANPTNCVSNIHVWNENMVEVKYTKEEGFEDPLCNVNVVIAAYVTTQARLKLYEYLELLQKDVLYFDTDSIVYLKRTQTPLVPTGNYLGNMTNELEDYGPGAYIREFVSAGPKNYAYEVVSSTGEVDTVVKIRGFTLDSITSKRLNLKTLKRKVFAFVHGGFKEETKVVMWRIVRSREGHLKTIPQTKTYSLVVDKRYVTKDFLSWPYGY